MPSIQELFALNGRVAIVTGGSRGLGEEMAEGLAEAGAALMICARREQWLTPTIARFAARGFRVEGLVADVANPADVQAVVDKTIAIYGRIDILVNNAGITWGARPEDMALDKWQKVIDVNLYATRASDIDVVYVHGFGFPRHRGGPMFYADTVGLATVLARVKGYRQQCGDYWRPSPLLEKLAIDGRGFHGDAA